MPLPNDPPSNARAGVLVTLGMACLAIAVYYLVINPGASTSVPSIDLGEYGRVGGQTQTIVNLQKLAIGMAAAIAGSVFLTGGVVAWRD